MKAFIIHLPDREHSLKHAQSMLSTLLSYEGIEPELFAGIPGDVALEWNEKDKRVLFPFSIKSDIVNVENIKNYIKPELWQQFNEEFYLRIFQRQHVGSAKGKMSTPGVLGCFYSHLSLWEKCVALNEPIMIFEDDVKFYRGFVPIEWKDILILSLGKTAYLNEPYDQYLNNPKGSPQPMPWSASSMPGTSGYAIKPRIASGLIKYYRSYFSPSDNALNKSVCEIECHNYLMGRHLTDEEGNVSLIKTKIWRDVE